MQILHINDSIALEAGGVSRFILDQAQALAGEGFDIDILAQRVGSISYPWGGEPGPHIAVHLCAPPVHPRFPSSEIKRVLPEHIAACDVVHLHGMWQVMNNRAALLARQFGKPYVCSIHGMLDPWSMRQRTLRKRVFHWMFETERLQGAAAVHFTAEDELVKARRWLPAGIRTVVIPCVVDASLFASPPGRDAARRFFPQLPGRERGPWVLFLSRIHEKKGLHLLVEAFARLPERLRTAQLVIAGTGDRAYLARVRGLVARLGIGERVHFVGLVDGEAKAALLAASEIMALPSSQENFGLVYPEALARQTPVMLTEAVNIYREIMAAGAGYLVRQEVGDICDKLVEALSDPEQNRRRGQAGRRWVLEALATEGIVRQWREVYGSIGRPPR